MPSNLKKRSPNPATPSPAFGLLEPLLAVPPLTAVLLPALVPSFSRNAQREPLVLDTVKRAPTRAAGGPPSGAATAALLFAPLPCWCWCWCWSWCSGTSGGTCTRPKLQESGLTSNVSALVTVAFIVMMTSLEGSSTLTS
ncbi:hypothetical protein DQ04_17241000 [Trypanosoma grayi]|uniref:hypothetical protein n=1 Tax=Trypanosoma grayi TaxID=71804 RepID=UPI0004F4A187|nr:hypothetical protein DQ04_17241000 [Trypanosoma grayi]KEG05927.1 hypothetical protein DQ04_17241000 [Trypanosoma grayi]